jgi:hypothetical protein
VTKVVNTAERISRWLGREPWDLVVLRSPGTPAAALLLLEAYQRTGRREYLAAAQRNGDLLVNLQLPSGGWFSEMPAYGNQLATWFRLIVPWVTLDDDVTPGAVRLLLSLWKETGDERYRRAAEGGLDLLLQAQLPSGAWPLTWRPALLRWLSPSFEDQPSLNDEATAAVIPTLLLGARLLDRPDLLAAARRAGDWLIEAQGKEEAGGAGWAQQYDDARQPVPARAFEPVALATWETKHAIEALLELARATGDHRYCEAAVRALRWLVRSAIAPGCWARFYALEGGDPIYLDIEGKPVASVLQAKRPYRWQGDFGIPALLAEIGLDASGATLRAGQASALPRLPGDAGECPHAPRREVPRIEIRNPRVRIGEAGTRMALARDARSLPCDVASAVRDTAG